MCLALPMKIEKLDKDIALASSDGLKRRINVQFLKKVKVGDYVVVHAGFAIEKLDEKAAKETLKLFKEIKP